MHSNDLYEISERLETRLGLKTYVAIIGATFAFFCGLVVGYKRGTFDEALEENKIAAGCLRTDDLKISSEFREYLKGRIYWNISTKYPNDGGYLLRNDWDFGPVNLVVLKRPIYAKGPIAAQPSQPPHERAQRKCQLGGTGESYTFMKSFEPPRQFQSALKIYSMCGCIS